MAELHDSFGESMEKLAMSELVILIHPFPVAVVGEKITVVIVIVVRQIDGMTTNLDMEKTKSILMHLMSEEITLVGVVVIAQLAEQLVKNIIRSLTVK